MIALISPFEDSQLLNDMFLLETVNEEEKVRYVF